MILYFADRNLQIIGTVSSELYGGIRVYDDLKTSDIDSGLTTLEAYVDYTDDTRTYVKQITEVGNYVLRYDGDDYEVYSIVQTEDAYPDSMISIYAEDAGLGLLNVTAGEFAASAAQTISWYILKYASSSGWEIGRNELPTQTRKLKWEGESTGTERIRSIATQFGAEIGYRFDIDGFEIVHKYIDIYQKRGSDTEMELRVGREIKKITENRTVENLVTALRVKGGTPEGSSSPITLAGYTYDDGDIYVNASGILFCRSAAQNYPRSANDGGYIYGTYTYDTTSQQTLCKHAITELKKRMVPQVTYSVELLYLPGDMHLGDTIRITDKTGDTYLSARVLKLTESTYNEKITATFGDFLPQSSGISSRIESLAEEIKDISSRSATYTWAVYSNSTTEGEITTDPTGMSYIGLAYNKTSDSPDLTDHGLYRWQSVTGGGGVDSYQLATNAVTTVSSTTVTAYLIHGTEDVTSAYASSCFSWTKVTESGSTSLGTGYSKTVTAADMGYGGVIRCKFTS